jgi:hypothetical protein
VILAPDVVGIFVCEIFVITGASYEKDWLYVPARLLTEAVVWSLLPYPGEEAQRREVSEDQAVVRHTVFPILTEGVRFNIAKLAPVTVSE